MNLKKLRTEAPEYKWKRVKINSSLAYIGEKQIANYTKKVVVSSYIKFSILDNELKKTWMVSIMKGCCKDYNYHNWIFIR